MRRDSFGWILFTASVLGVVGCVGCASCRCKNLSLDMRDSVRVEVVAREVVVHDTLYVEIPYSEQHALIEGDTSILENDFSRSAAIILPTGELSHTLETREQRLSEPIKTEVEVRDSIIYRERHIEKILYRERELTRWQRFAISGFYLLFVLALVFVLGRVF